MDWKDQEFFMGHVLPGSMDTYFDKTKMEEFREKYRRVKFFANGGVTKDEMLDAMRREILALAGYAEDEIKQLGDLSKHSKEDMDQMIDRKWQERMGLKNGQTQKVVPQAEVKKHIAEGWEFVSWLDDQRSEAIVKLPSK